MNKKIFTIPNILSFFRLLLIPVIIWLFFNYDNNYAAIGVMLLSGLTDVVDGYIARHFNMISDVGKILDPCADKLTQASVLVCIAIKFIPVRFLLALMVVKELILGIVGLVTVRRTNVVTGAFWHGKLCTAVLYCVMLLHMLFMDMPYTLSFILVTISASIMVLSLILYVRGDLAIIRRQKAE